MPRGGWREAARGKVGRPPETWRPRLPHESGVQMKLIAWARYGRTTTDEETAAALAALISEEAARVAASKAD
jgi:hypothetical protein